MICTAPIFVRVPILRQLIVTLSIWNKFVKGVVSVMSQTVPLAQLTLTRSRRKFLSNPVNRLPVVAEVKAVTSLLAPEIADPAPTTNLSVPTSISLISLYSVMSARVMTPAAGAGKSFLVLTMTVFAEPGTADWAISIIGFSGPLAGLTRR